MRERDTGREIPTMSEGVITFYFPVVKHVNLYMVSPKESLQPHKEMHTQFKLCEVT